MNYTALLVLGPVQDAETPALLIKILRVWRMQMGVERDCGEKHMYVKQEMCTVYSAKWPTDEWLRTANCFLLTGPLVVER